MTQRRFMLVSIASFIILLGGMQAAVPQVPTQQRPGATPRAVSSYSCTDPVNNQRDNGGQPVSTACGAISGIVVRAGTTIAIANAHVVLGPPEGAKGAETLETLTNAFGQYFFPSVKVAGPPPLAGYTLAVDADGYQPAVFGQVSPSGSGETFALKGGMHFLANFQLNRYQTASGTVRTADGLPVAAATVRAYRIRYGVLGRRMKIVKTVLTDDLGNYRLFGLEPGDYYFSASYSERSRDIPLFGATLSPNLSNPDAGYVTQYFPAAVSPPAASVVTMLPNAEKTNVNFVLTDVENFKVHVGVFAASSAGSHNFNIAMMPEGAELEDAEEYVVHRAEDSSDFEIRNVGAGHYSLVAFDKSRILSEPTPITVDRDLDTRVTVYDPLDVPGIVVDESGDPVPKKWTVRLVRVDPAVGQTIRADLDAGNFVVPDLGPASYDVYVDGLPLGTYIKEIQFPVDDGPNRKFGRIRIEPDRPERHQDPDSLRWRSNAGIRIVLAHSDLIVVGFVSTATFVAPGIIGAQLVLEPDRDPQSPYAFREDRFFTGSAETKGFFRWVGVPAGVYYMYAYYEIPQGLYLDSQFHDRIFSKGTKGEVKPGPTIPDRIFEMHGCEFPPDPMPYVDPIYLYPTVFNPVPPPDAGCLVIISREDSRSIFR